MKNIKRLIFFMVGLGLSFGLIFNASAAGRINFMLSGGPLQSLEYKGKGDDPERASGYGLVFDYIFKNAHAIAVDYYRFSEGLDETDELYSSTDESSGLFLGYRYHFPEGFYIGGGFTLLDTTRTLQDFLFLDRNGNIMGPNNLIVESERATLITLTLGYQYVFPSGFALGVHSLNTLSKALNVDTVSFGGETVATEEVGVESETEDFSVRSIGFILGYVWR